MRSAWQRINSGVDGVSGIFDYICNILILILTIIIFYEVIVRYVFASPTSWVTPASQYILGAICFLGAAYCLSHEGHIRVDIFVIHLSSRASQLMIVIGEIIAFVFCVVLGWQGYLFWHEALTMNFTSGDIWDVHMWIPYIVFPFGMALLCVQYTVQIVNKIIKLREHTQH